MDLLFQSTPPARGATLDTLLTKVVFPISIHAPREGGDQADSTQPYSITISIHAPREGGDDEDEDIDEDDEISIHAPREGGDRSDTLLS